MMKTNKLYLYAITALLTISCGQSDTHKATSLLNEARSALSLNDFNSARNLIDSLRETYPNETDVRHLAISFMDSLELIQAEQEYKVADSILAFKHFELEDLKTQFVLEKQERFQTTGYYVTPDYAGSKSSVLFFPEVEETGSLLMVEISRDTHVDYNFTEVKFEPNTTTTPACPLSRSLSDKEQMSYEKCFLLSRAIKQYKAAQESKDKLSLKIRFFAKKLSQAPN